MGVSIRETDQHAVWLAGSDNVLAGTVSHVTMAQRVKRAEDARLLALMAQVAGLPYRLRVVSWPDKPSLDVYAGHVRLASLGPAALSYCDTAEHAAGLLGEAARLGWFTLPALPVPDNVTPGDN